MSQNQQSNCPCTLMAAIHELWGKNQCLSEHFPATKNRLTNRVFPAGEADQQLDRYVTIRDGSQTSRRFSSSGRLLKTIRKEHLIQIRFYFSPSCLTGIEVVETAKCLLSVLMGSCGIETAIGVYYCFREIGSPTEVSAYPGKLLLQQNYSVRLAQQVLLSEC